MAGLNVRTLFDQVQSHAMRLGLFDRVGTHEPKNAPGNGLTAAIWADQVQPAGAVSGLAATTARVAFNVRLYSNMLQEPQDAIDPNLTDALDTLFAAYSGDFTLDGTAMAVDLLGMAGQPLQAQAGYLNQDNKLFRVYTITLPLLVAGAWDQVA